jgi:hypothetical protein
VNEKVELLAPKLTSWQSGQGDWVKNAERAGPSSKSGPARPVDITGVALSFIRDNAEAIMKVLPISYVKDAELGESLFDPQDMSGAISSVYTMFFVDHTEPHEALAWVREGLDWPLGELLDGYEFLLITMIRRRDRSRSRSSTQP